MAEDKERIFVLHALDAVDRGRRWAILGVVALFLATTIALATLFSAAGRAAGQNTASLKAMWAASAAELLFIACCTAVVMFHVTRTARAVLRAIELRRPE